MTATAVFSVKRNRVYRRKFDYAEARRRWQSGVSIPELAREYGVSYGAVCRAVDPKYRERLDAASAAFVASGECVDCGGPCSRYHGGRCLPCSARARATSVREDTLWCSTCREWKPDHAFPWSRCEPQRRDRHNTCRPCNTVLKRAYRRRKAAEASRVNVTRGPVS